MIQNQNTIDCPQCGTTINIEKVITGRLEAQYKEQLAKERTKIEQESAKKEALLLEKQNEFEDKVKKQNEIFQERLNKERDLIQAQLKEQLGTKIKEEFEQQLQAQKEELKEKSEVLSQYKAKEIELERLKRQVKEEKQNLELEFEKRIVKEREEYEEAIVRREVQRSELRLKEKDKQLEDQKKLIEEMKRKSEQGSMQMQGEVMELAIEEMIKREFPYDDVAEVGKGVRGADVLQTVRNEMNQACGVIIIESKRTKSFSNDWIPKLKDDMRSSGADIALLITEVLPKEIEKFGELNGVWICNYQDSLGLMYVLRQMIIKTHFSKLAKVNKSDKMELLYHFLTGDEFKNQVTAIVEGFTTMKEDLEREKRSMQSLWKRRDKQIEKVIDNTIDMYSSIKGIAGNAIQPISQLELPDGDEE
jgi:hypothetical protein